MTRECIATGKTIDEAILAACLELGCDRDSVEAEVLEAPTKSLFGLKVTNAKVRVTCAARPEDKAVAFLGEILKIMEIPAECVTSSEEDRITVDLQGPDMGIIIGRRGETLDALQYLTSLVVNKGEQSYTKVTVDTENYRQKREETLVRLARKLASKVLKYKRSMSLEPMNPYERRIIHSTLQEFEGVTTSSVGVDPNRKVVVTCEGAAPEQESFRSGGNRGERGTRGGRPPRSEDRRPRPQAEPRDEFASATVSHRGESAAPAAPHHVSDADLWSHLGKKEEK